MLSILGVNTVWEPVRLPSVTPPPILQTPPGPTHPYILKKRNVPRNSITFFHFFTANIYGVKRREKENGNQRRKTKKILYVVKIGIFKTTLFNTA